MANWRQIQGRIRRARSGADPVAKLSELYQKTRDAMVAFELAQLEDKAEHSEEAIRWYTAAAERFRREDWKKKAEEALIRLGGPVPPRSAEGVPSPHGSNGDATAESAPLEGAPASDEQPEDVIAGTSAAESPSTESNAEKPAAEGARQGRRRGRRGGRKHRRRPDGAAGPSPRQPQRSSSPAALAPSGGEHTEHMREPRVELPARPIPEARVEFQEPRLPSERAAHGRASEPALASRVAKLESLLRRLLTGPLHRLDEVDEAPAGPGVFLLSDSDLTTSYYVEVCQTLRIGLANLTRTPRGRGERSGPSLKARLAEHLEISESKVSDYLKKYCVVRWIQLDEDAHYLMNFAVSVLRTPLNVE